jgi:hypothetical protein
MRGQVAANREREVDIGVVGHASRPGFCQKKARYSGSDGFAPH